MYSMYQGVQLMILCALVCGTLAKTAAPTSCPTGYDVQSTILGSCYMVANSTMDWFGAETFCMSTGGHLADITSLEELGFLREILHRKGNGYHQGQLLQCGKADIVFILDDSGSIGSSNWHKMLNFTTNIVSHFNVGPDTIRIGVISYSSTARLAFDLDEHSNSNAVINAIQRLTYTSGGSTNTGAAIRLMHSTMFTTTHGARAGVPSIGIVITDGQSDDKPKPIQEANAARSKNIVLFAIGVGSAVESELTQIANRPSSQYVFSVQNFGALSAIESRVINVTCHAGKQSRGLWLGGNDIGKQGSWMWVGAHEPLNPSLWDKNEPDGGAERCALFLYNGSAYHMHDSSCNQAYNPMCERSMVVQ